MSAVSAPKYISLLDIQLDARRLHAVVRFASLSALCLNDKQVTRRKAHFSELRFPVRCRPELTVGYVLHTEFVYQLLQKAHHAYVFANFNAAFWRLAHYRHSKQPGASETDAKLLIGLEPRGIEPLTS